MKSKPILYLAPLHGVTNSVFRNALLRHFSGIDAAMAPFINSINSETAYAKGRGNHFKDLLSEHNKGVTLIPQILSNDSKSFIETATTIKGLGYNEVNWNLGCPFPMVTGKKRGSGLLPHPDLIERFLSETCANLDLHISVKVRLGLNDATEIKTLMPIFNSFPLKKIIIHPRIGIQMYNGSVDINGFSETAMMSTHPVMYNGDIKDSKTFCQLHERFPSVQEWMIGRWAINNPFIFEQLKGINASTNKTERVRDFHEDLYGEYRRILCGPVHVLDKMKEIWTYLGKSFSGADQALKDISRSKTIEAYESGVHTVFSQGIWLA